jgi:hypothetical protein
MEEAKCYQCGFRHQVEVIVDNRLGTVGHRFMCSCGVKGQWLFSSLGAHDDGLHHLKMVTDHG